METVHEGRINIPGIGRLPIAYLQNHTNGLPPGPLGYLHSAGSSVGKARPELLAMKKQGYDAELTRYRSAFAKWAAGKKFDLIVGVPSSRADSQPYVATIATASAGAKNISECFAKQAGTKAGEDPDAEKLRDAISSDLPDLATVTSVVVVDDTIKTGTTIQVILERLYAAGLSRNADIVLVAPLVLIPVEEPA